MNHDAIGLDIGGANIKAATASGLAWTHPFELWRHPERLATELAHVRTQFAGLTTVAVTMTGELCDCFHTKRDGVTHILAAVQEAFPAHTIRVWTTAGTFVDPEQAQCEPLRVAAANWLATATIAARMHPTGYGLFLDTGSTTTDIIPFADGRPTPSERTDMGRLQSHELVYTGVKRTPVCALLGARVAAEWFATTHDVYVRLCILPEESTCCDTADRRPMTMANAHARLSRMLGGDPELTRLDETESLALAAFQQQQSLIADALVRVAERFPVPPSTVIIAGSGEFLAHTAWLKVAREQPWAAHAEVRLLSDHWRSDLSDVAAAYAVAQLVNDQA